MYVQKYIAMETLQVFAPLARLLGMYRIKSELEELSFMFAYPEEYEEVKHRVEVLRKKQEEVVLEVISTQSLLFPHHMFRPCNYRSN